MAHGRRRLWKVVIYGATSIQPRLMAGVLGLLYASAFSLEEYGIYGVLSAVAAALGILTDFGVPAAVLRNYFDQQHDPVLARQYLSSVVYGSAVISLATLPLFAVGLFLSWGWLGIGSRQVTIFVVLLLLTSFFGRSAEVLGAICRAKERPAAFAVGRIVEGVVTFGSAGATVFVLRWGLVGALVAGLAGRASASLAYHVVLFNDLKIGRRRLQWAEMKDCFAFGLPLVPSRLATWVRQLALRPLLTHLVSMSEVGLFSFASSVASLPNVLSSAVDLALSPIYFRKRVTGTGQFARVVMTFSVLFVAIMFPLWTGAVLFCQEIINVLAGPRYVGAAPVCTILLVAAFCRMQHPFLLRQVHFIRKTWILPVVGIPCGALSVLGTAALAGTYGIVAAGWAVALSDLVLFVAITGVIYRAEPVNHPVCMAIGLTIVLGALAVWVGLGEPLPAEWPRIGIKIGIVVIAAASAGLWWVWPNRNFLRELARS